MKIHSVWNPKPFQGIMSGFTEWHDAALAPAVVAPAMVATCIARRWSGNHGCTQASWLRRWVQGRKVPSSQRALYPAGACPRRRKGLLCGRPRPVELKAYRWGGQKRSPLHCGSREDMPVICGPGVLTGSLCSSDGCTFPESSLAQLGCCGLWTSTDLPQGRGAGLL